MPVFKTEQTKASEKKLVQLHLTEPKIQIITSFTHQFRIQNNILLRTSPKVNLYKPETPYGLRSRMVPHMPW